MNVWMTFSQRSIRQLKIQNLAARAVIDVHRVCFMPQLQTPVDAYSLVNVQKRKNMAQTAELEVVANIEKSKNRRQFFKQSKTQAVRPVTRFGKRNRTSVDSQVQAAFKALRSKEQQMSARLASAEKFEAELDDRQRSLASIEQRLETRLDDLNHLFKSSTSIDLPPSFGDDVARAILLSLSGKLEQLVSDKLDLNQQNNGRSDELAALATTNSQLEQLLDNAKEELEANRLESEELRSLAAKQDEELVHLREQVAQLRDQFSPSGALEESHNSQIEQIATLQDQLAEAVDHVEALQSENDTLRQVRLSQMSDQQLAEVERLRQQVADLTAELTKAQSTSRLNAPHLSRTNESLSWEERKRLIMQQLENELDDNATGGGDRLEITEILRTSQAEIDRRDIEIRELQSIIEQQSNTSAGVAIGAAAIAQMMDADELVQQEREKLREIQKEWEDKLRQAEIELSMERAKLARERSLVEEQMRQAAIAQPVKPVATTDGGKPVRKWLEHLGLNKQDT